MSFNPDDFIALVNPEDKDLIKGVVMTLELLRSMNADRLNTILCQVRLARSIFPKEMLPAIESLEADFTLAMAFIDQARKYDKSHLLFKEGKNERTEGS